MQERELISFLPSLIFGAFGLGVLLFIVAVIQIRISRKSQTTWRLRRTAARWGGRLFLFSTALMAVTLFAAIVTGLGAIALRDVSNMLLRGPDDLYGIALEPGIVSGTPTVLPSSSSGIPTVEPTLAPTLASIETLLPPSPTRTPKPTETPSTVPTLTPFPTNTIEPTPTAEPRLNLTPLFNSTSRPAPDNAHIALIAAAEGVQPNDQPLNPRAEFAAGVTRIYLFFAFNDMANGVEWSRALYRDGVPFQGNVFQWSMGASGAGYFFFGHADGYPPGSYEARLYIGSEETTRLAFRVIG